MSVSRSAHCKRPDAEAARFRKEWDEALGRAIENVVDDWPAYGYRRVTHGPRRRGIVANQELVSRLMRESGLHGKRSCRYVVTADCDHDYSVYPNLAEGFVPSGPGRLWVTDITCLLLDEQTVYLATILDAWSRKVVGYTIGNLIETSLTRAALNSAWRDHQLRLRLIHHSDCRGEYASRDYRQRPMFLISRRYGR